MLPPIECYWLVNASPLNYDQWVGQNSGHILAICGPKYTNLSLPMRECPQFATPISDILLCSRDIRDQVATLSETVPKCFRAAKFRGGRKGLPNVWPNFINLDRHQTCGKPPSEIRRWKKRIKKDLNISSKTEWPVLTIVRAAIIRKCSIHFT